MELIWQQNKQSFTKTLGSYGLLVLAPAEGLGVTLHLLLPNVGPFIMGILENG